ncbi:DUF3391 domain-containing protein [Salinispirillum sp. LH 10-3-1]|uniref:DUF3391 domain-containing protein n=1 Tax=Salinispirillum sp. LH 10-3-1 TaxID=2952525 RepID=A0AB38YDR0_9GAMM
MASKDHSIMFPVDKLMPGLYVDIGLPWTDHPFLFKRFKIKTQQEVNIIQGLGLKEIKVFPERSDGLIKKHDAQTVAAEPADNSAAENASASGASDHDKMWAQKQQRIDEAAQFRNRRLKVDREYQETIKRVKNLTRDLKTAPANAIRDAGELIETLTEAFGDDGDVLMNLVSLSDSEFSIYHHALNVTVLALTLGAARGMQGEDLKELGIGAMLHDIGKILVPGQILAKEGGELNPSEQAILDSHPALGAKMAGRVGKLNDAIIEIIENHHEMLDGSGHPRQLREPDISSSAQMVTVANVYDNLCNPVNPNKAVTPKQAVATLYAKYRGRIDETLIGRFIQTMGVYPPGTVVMLSDDSIGLVVAVDAKALLKPQVLLYNPDIPKQEALMIDLNKRDDLNIVDVLKPTEYPKRIYDYLGIHERIGYFNERSLKA